MTKGMAVGLVSYADGATFQAWVHTDERERFRTWAAAYRKMAVKNVTFGPVDPSKEKFYTTLWSPGDEG